MMLPFKRWGKTCELPKVQKRKITPTYESLVQEARSGREEMTELFELGQHGRSEVSET